MQDNRDHPSCLAHRHSLPVTHLSFRKRMGFSEEEMLHAVIALGYTDTMFLRITRRKKSVIRILKPPVTTSL